MDAQKTNGMFMLSYLRKELANQLNLKDLWHFAFENFKIFEVYNYHDNSLSLINYCIYAYNVYMVNVSGITDTLLLYSIMNHKYVH